MTWGSPWDVALIFSPGQRHEIEEKHHRALLREDEGNEADPPSRVDLDAGVAVIRISPPGSDDDARPAPTDPLRATDADVATPEATEPATDPTPPGPATP